jgi:hypothetical protein
LRKDLIEQRMFIEKLVIPLQAQIDQVLWLMFWFQKAGNCIFVNAQVGSFTRIRRR